MKYHYEIFLQHASVNPARWREFLTAIANYFTRPSSWKIYLSREQNTLRYYLESNRPLPASLGLQEFLLRSVPSDVKIFPNSQKPQSARKEQKLQDLHYLHPYHNLRTANFLDLDRVFRKKHSRLELLAIEFWSCGSFYHGRADVYYNRNCEKFSRKLLLCHSTTLLANDFNSTRELLYKKPPQYLKSDKITKLLRARSESSLLEVDTFPYAATANYLHHGDYDFFKHSLVLGSSGSGKSRFIASLIDEIWQKNRDQYKIVVIDPHDALYRDCVHIAPQAVINFQHPTRSIDLFGSDPEDLTAAVELTLTLFRALIENCNGSLERVLRFATFLLMSANCFSFVTLRRLLLDLEFRNELLSQHQTSIPPHVAHFFLTDFNELKTQNYNDAIAPIIALIDEMQMVPVFSQEPSSESLASEIQNHFLTIFSLNRLKLGGKVVFTIANLILQQLFLLAAGRKLTTPTIVIIDEVAVVESPIIAQFLSELRKYQVSTILAGQYLGQISEPLQQSIFANVTNYYLFHVSRSDANLLSQNLKIPLATDDTLENRQAFLTSLKPRECLVQISHHDETLPMFKAHTVDYLELFNYSDSIAATLQNDPEFSARPPQAQTIIFDPHAACKYNSTDVTKLCSTSRKKFRR